MLSFVLPIIFLAAGVQSTAFRPTKYSAASPAQIRFAIENKYDDTGPGAKLPEAAYSTYKNLEDALIAYIDDPDTKLPSHERAKAIDNLYRINGFIYGDNNIPTRVDAFTGKKQKIVPIVLSRYNKYDIDTKPVLNLKEMKGLQIHELKARDPFKWQKEHIVKPSHLDIARYNKDIEYDLFKTKPDANFVYGPKRDAQEIHDASGAAYGYYTVVQPDGKRRTVHYQADPTKGFRSSVQRVFKD